MCDHGSELSKMPSCGKGASMKSDSANKCDGQHRSTGTPQDPLANCLIRFFVVLTQVEYRECSMEWHPEKYGGVSEYHGRC